MPTIHMIHGFCGTGKTTFAKKLEAETGAARFTPDEWMADLHGQNPPAGDFAALEKTVHEAIWAAAETALEDGADVILDFGFWTRAERDETRDRARKLGADVKLYRLHCPDDVARMRILRRTASLPAGELYIDDHAFDAFRKRFEPVDLKTEDCILIET